MGYGHYFYLVDKSKAEKVRYLSYEELFEYSEENYPEAIEKYVYDDGEVDIYFNFHRIFSQEKIYNFGKLYFCNTAERIYSKGEPLFRNEATQKHFEEYDPYIMGKEGMLEAIECYRDKIKSYYEKLMKVCKGEEVEFFEYTAEKHIRGKLFKWNLNDTVDTNLEHLFLTNSCEYEHAIFNLLFLLKTIDWDKKTLLFYGW